MELPGSSAKIFFSKESSSYISGNGKGSLVFQETKLSRIST